MENREVQFAIFKIGDVKFGIDIMRVREITRYQKTSKIPGTPPFIEGVINLRGIIIPVVDLRKKFGLPPREPDKKTRIIVATVLKKLAGLLVDEVIEVLRLPEDAVKPAPKLGETFSADFLQGVCEKGEDIIFIIDFDKLLSTKEQIDYLDFHTILEQQKDIEQKDTEKKESEDEKPGSKQPRKTRGTGNTGRKKGKSTKKSTNKKKSNGEVANEE